MSAILVTELETEQKGTSILHKREEMLQPIIHFLNSQRICLASGSPRRKEILEKVGLKFEVFPSVFEENVDKSVYSTPTEYVRETAYHKMQDVVKRLDDKKKVYDLIIGADTVLSQDGEIIEKPRDRDHAFQMLSNFSGKSHTVYTGVVLYASTSNPEFHGDDMTEDRRYYKKQFEVGTEVFMSHLTSDVINAYIDTKEPMDKAGGYGIQAIGATLIEGIHGDYYNVMGFPVHKFAKHLLSMTSYSNKINTEK